MLKYCLFYGTLMNKMGRDHDPDYFEYVQDVTLSGNMFDVGSFPAVIMGNGLVQAELFKCNHKDSHKYYDGYEGYSGSKDSDLYTRTIVYVPEVEDYAWIYTWNRVDVGSLTPVPHGDYKKYREEVFRGR